MLCSLFSYLFLTNVDFRASFFDCFPFMNFVPAFLYLQMIFDIQAVVLALMFFYRTDAVVGSNLWQDSPYTLGCVVKHLLYDISAFSKFESGILWNTDKDVFKYWILKDTDNCWIKWWGNTVLQEYSKKLWKFFSVFTVSLYSFSVKQPVLIRSSNVKLSVFSPPIYFFETTM